MMNTQKLVLHGSFSKQQNVVLIVVNDPSIANHENVVVHADINQPNEVGVFIQELNRIIPCEMIKAFTFLANEYEFDSFKSSYFFRQKMHEYCHSKGISCTFFNSDHFNLHKTIRDMDPNVAIGEEVLIICRKPNPRTGSMDVIDGIFVTKEARGFRFKKYANRKSIGFTPEWKREFLGDSNPTRVVIVQYTNDSNHLIGKWKNLFKKEKVQVSSYGNTFNEICKKMNDFALQKKNNTPTPNDILPMSLNNFVVKYGDDIIAAVPLDRVLPIEDILILEVNHQKSITVSTDQYHNSLIQTFNLESFKCKKVKMIFKVDINSFFDLKINAMDDESIQMNIQNDKKAAIKHRIVFDQRCFTIYEIEEGDQKVLKNLEGYSKTPVCLVFPSGSNPIVGHAAMEMFETSRHILVYDLIKIASTDSPDKIIRGYKFTIYKNVSGTTMVQLWTKAEEELHYPIVYLMALILDHAKRLICQKNCESPKEFEIGFNGVDPTETLKKNLIEANKLLKIETTFV